MCCVVLQLAVCKNAYICLFASFFDWINTLFHRCLIFLLLNCHFIFKLFHCCVVFYNTAYISFQWATYVSMSCVLTCLQLCSGSVLHAPVFQALTLKFCHPLPKKSLSIFPLTTSSCHFPFTDGNSDRHFLMFR